MTDLQTQPTSSTSQPALSPDGSPLPMPWVQRLFERLTAICGSAMGTVYAGVDPELVKAEWAEALAGFSEVEVRRGIAAARTRRFPPNLPEFLHLCRPALDPEVAWHEAEAGMRSHAERKRFDWSHPAVYWAGREFGYELRTSTFAAQRKRWEPTLAALWALRAWPQIPDPTIARIGNEPPAPTAMNPAKMAEAAAKLSALRQRMTGYSSKAEQDAALLQCEEQVVEQAGRPC